jgi:hypothetical protein
MRLQRDQQKHGRNCRVSAQSGSDGSPSFLPFTSAKGKSGVKVFRNAFRKLRRERRSDLEGVTPEADYGSAYFGFEFSSALKRGAAIMAKEKKQDSGWQFPKALEIVKCKEGNKEFMKERPARRPFGNTVLICEYPLDGDAIQEPNARMITWRLAKRAARDFLRVSFMTSAIVTATKADKPFTVVRVYGRY